MIVSQDGHDQIQNYQAKPSTQGEAADSLVTAYTLTHRQQYLDAVRLVLQSLFESSGLWDKTRGGFFFALDMSKGRLSTDYKETRSQSLTLIGLHHYNQVTHQQQFMQWEQQLITVITDHFYQRTYHGFVYRLTPDFQIYVSRPGTGIGVEDYFTTEAMGSSLDALQQTELIQ
jgi:mannose/cellobiose epimerase-like protein (N-acyl-D-glucosamine 2-epimerase family)